MKVVNLTPHPVIICDQDGSIVRVIEPSGMVARVSSKTRVTGTVDGIPVTESEFGTVEGLPEPKRDTIYIVSLLVQQAAPERKDLYRPDTGPANVVRDANGNIVGVKALAAK